MTMPAIQWLLGQLNVKANAPRWAGIAVAAFASWLATVDIALTGKQTAALSIVVAGIITTVVQKLATWPRADLIDGGTH